MLQQSSNLREVPGSIPGQADLKQNFILPPIRISVKRILFCFVCKQFWDHHNNYYIIMGNSMFKRTFQSHLDPDEIQTESKQS